MKPPRMPDPRKLLAGLAAARADKGVPALDEQLQELERRLQCRARQSRDRRLRKLMEPAEPPERALTLRAMEQIRFLRRAFPEEWPDGRLAQGFGVTREVIRRVLKSRFCPSAERGLKQDARAGARPNPAPAGGAAPGALSLPPAPEPHPDGGRRGRPPPGTPRRGAFGSGGQAARGSPWLSGERSGTAEPGERGNRGGAS